MPMWVWKIVSSKSEQPDNLKIGIMKYSAIIKTTLTAAIFTLTASVFAQSFEGRIEFTKTHGKVSNTYRYYVKGDMVRIEEIGDEDEIYGIQLVDTKNQKIWGLSPEKEMYMDVIPKSEPEDPNTTVEVSEIFVTMHEQKCKEYIVTCDEDETVIDYYITEGNYDFFVPMLKTLKRKDKQAVYYLELGMTDGQFPVKSVEKKEDGTLVSVLEVTEISEEELDDSLFEIPENYRLFER